MGLKITSVEEALARLSNGVPLNVENQNAQRQGKLKICAASVAREAGVARSLLWSKSVRYAGIINRIKKAQASQQVPSAKEKPLAILKMKLHSTHELFAAEKEKTEKLKSEVTRLRTANNHLKAEVDRLIALGRQKIRVVSSEDLS